MINIINNSVDNWIITLIVIPLMIFSFYMLFKPWFKLSQIYESKSASENILWEYQNGILGETRIKGYLNIGIAKKGLYLSLASPLNYLINPLLINWDAITKIEHFFDQVWGKCYQFSIGQPTITTIVLTEEIVQKIQNESGKLLIHKS